MPAGVASSGAGRGISVQAAVTTRPCTHAPSDAGAMTAIDNRRILRFPSHSIQQRELSPPARRDKTGQMPNFKLRDGAELYYDRQGNGPPLFLVPGLGGDGRWWTPNVADLAKQFTVVV